jgi:molybdate transport system regulatory protein
MENMVDLQVAIGKDGTGMIRERGRITRDRRIDSQASQGEATLQTARRNIMGARLRTKVWLEHDGRFILGDGGLQLLLSILEHGSLRAAARAIGWSYRHAWGYLRRADEVVGTPLTVPRPGRGRGRGTSLTEPGRLLMEQLVAARNRVDDLLGASGPTREEVAAREPRAGERETRAPGRRRSPAASPRSAKRRSRRSVFSG